MPDTTIAAPDLSTTAPPPPPALTPEQLALKRRFPTALDMRARARKRLPGFAFEYVDGGAGGADRGIARNWGAFDAIEMMPRYGNVERPSPTDVTLFGRAYAAPIGIAPIGGPSTGFPGAETYFAKAAQEARVPYTLGVLSAITMERAADLAPDVLWLQLYRFSRDEHRIGMDLVRRAEACGVNALVLTWDTPVRTTRTREVKAGITNPFRLTMRLKLDALSSPPWMLSMMRNGIPKYVNIKPYMDGDPDAEQAAAFMRREQGGAFTWDEIARYRDAWKGPLILKGVLHPADAERLVSLGIDGIFITNHGGRQVEALPASADALPAIAAAVGGKATILVDSGVRSGVDVARAIALGADACLAGKAFLWSLGALGEDGPGHMIRMFREELSSTLGQLGCRTVAELRNVKVRHPGAWRSEDFG
jgi:L-lactate dehydrogenase (cytochrome)